MTSTCIFDKQLSSHSCYDFNYEENWNFASSVAKNYSDKNTSSNIAM
jgi:hypothetical protein